MKDAHEGRSMTTQFNEGLTVREFGDALLSIAEFRAWLTRTGKQIETVPPLPESGFIQVEALFCGIELAAQVDYPTDTALAIVARNPVLANHEMAAFAPQWLIGAERHTVWRREIRAAIECGELVLNDPVTKLPIGLPLQAGETTGSTLGARYSSSNVESRVHKSNTRSNQLDHAIALAKQRSDSDDPHAVWASLCTMAAKQELRPDVLLGVDEEGVKYRKDNDEPGWLNKRAFMARWSRRNATSR